MERFVRRQNLLRYRQLLEAVADEDDRHRILRLLAERKAEAKGYGRQRQAFEATAVLCLIQIKVPSSSVRKYVLGRLCLVHPPTTPNQLRRSELLVLHHQGAPPFVDSLAGVRGTMMNLRAPSSITGGLMLEAFALLALAS